MQSICLTTVSLPDRHTASNIAEWLEQVVARLEIPHSKIIAIVHDNGANIVAAANILEEKHRWSSVPLHWPYFATCDQCCVEVSRH